MAKKKTAASNHRAAWAEKRRQTRKAKTWAQITRLADDALAALDGGKVKDARRYLLAIRGVSSCADEERR
jgi:hypothetical protein